MAQFERNTTGFTADVEMYDDNTLAKIYRDDVPDEDVQREILCTQFVQGKELAVPEYRGDTEIAGKRAILLEYIPGESAMKALVAGAREPVQLGMDFAEIHFKIHQCHADGLEEGKARLEKQLRMSEYNLGADLTYRCLKLLDSLPEMNRLCHNDFHPGNMIYKDKSMIAIDWSDATASNPLSDVAHTVQAFDFGMRAKPGQGNISEESYKRMQQAHEAIKVFIRSYEKHYAKCQGMSLQEFREILMPWNVVVSASRFYREWDCNKGDLLKFFYDFFMEHPVK